MPATVAITALVVIVRLAIGGEADHTFASVLAVGVTPAAVLLPVAGSCSSRRSGPSAPA